jgi:cell surface protein SprA
MPEQVCLNLTAETMITYIRDYEFDRHRQFDLGRMGDTVILHPGDTIAEFILFTSWNNSSPSFPVGEVYPNWIAPDSANDAVIVSRFRVWPDSASSLYSLSKTLFYIQFSHRSAVSTSSTLAYWMVVKHPDGPPDTIGAMKSGTEAEPHLLQLLRPRSMEPTDPLWAAEWKNVYDLRRQNISYEDLDFDIFKGIYGDEDNPANLNHQNGKHFLQFFGLDKKNTTGGDGPDGKIDDDPAIINLEAGLLFFPNRYPFSSPELIDPVSYIYETEFPQEERDSSKYYIRITNRIRSSQIRLGYVDIIEGSDEITHNGRRLNRGSDYYIDYELGTVAFLREDVLDPNANVTICFEYIP